MKSWLAKKMHSKKKKTAQRLDELEKALKAWNSAPHGTQQPGPGATSQEQIPSEAPAPPPAPAPVQPPPGCVELLKFVRRCNSMATAVMPGDNAGRPFCVVVGDNKSVRFSEGAAVTISMGGQHVEGEVVSFLDSVPHVAFVELLKPLEIDGAGGHVTQEQSEEVVLLRDGVQLPGRVVVPKSVNHGEDLKPMGVIQGARTGDIVVNWKGGTPRIYAVVIHAEEDGSFFELRLGWQTAVMMETLRGKWYYAKYPDRVAEVPGKVL